MEQLCSHCLDFHEIKYLSIFQKSVEKIQVSLQLDKKSGYLTWKPVHILIIFCSVYRRMMFQAKVVEKIKTHFMLNNFFFFFQKSYLLWPNVEKCCRAGHATDDNMACAIACWVRKATNTCSEYIILIAFPVHQWLHKSASVLCCTYIACLFRVYCMIYIFVYRLQCFYLLH